mmetsp:Transcript_39431/g.122293  ORF Transcript_39431/g.122293 Transcript_39431/m.122293 type:complete len:315 (-) Transcript_39431:817-1761(-)
MWKTASPAACANVSPRKRQPREKSSVISMAKSRATVLNAGRGVPSALPSGACAAEPSPAAQKMPQLVLGSCTGAVTSSPGPGLLSHAGAASASSGPGLRQPSDADAGVSACKPGPHLLGFLVPGQQGPGASSGCQAGGTVWPGWGGWGLSSEDGPQGATGALFAGLMPGPANRLLLLLIGAAEETVAPSSLPGSSAPPALENRRPSPVGPPRGKSQQSGLLPITEQMLRQGPRSYCHASDGSGESFSSASSASLPEVGRAHHVSTTSIVVRFLQSIQQWNRKKGPRSPESNMVRPSAPIRRKVVNAGNVACTKS